MSKIQTVENTIDGLVKIGTEQVIAWLISAVPFFAMPLVKQLTRQIVFGVLTVAFKKVKLGVFTIQIQGVTKEQAKKYNQAHENLHNAKTKEEKEKAINELIKKHDDLIKLGKY